MKGRPELDRGSIRILQAFDDLSTERGQGGMSAGPIRVTAVYHWAKHHEMPYDVANHLWRVIRLIDAKLRTKGPR